MGYETMVVETTKGVTKITLNRPDNANALNLKMAEELMKVSIHCIDSPDTRAVLLTGKGKMFCAGGDLVDFSKAGDQISATMLEMTTYLHAAISRFARMNAPLIIAVNGTAAGAGMSLACIGDLVLAAESSKFTMAYTKAGLAPDGSSSYYLPRLIGVRRTKELMITNRVLSATEALEWGLINQICPNDKLMEEAEKLVDSLASGPTLAYGAVKKLILESTNESLETQMETEAQLIAQMGSSVDGKEGIAAFLAKRKPTFQGK